MARTSKSEKLEEVARCKSSPTTTQRDRLEPIQLLRGFKFQWHPSYKSTSPTKASGNNKYQFQETSPRPLPSYDLKLAIFRFRQSAPCSRCHAAAGIWEQPSKTNVSKVVALPRTWRRTVAPSTPLLFSPKHLAQGETGRIEQQRNQFKVTLWQLTPIYFHQNSNQLNNIPSQSKCDLGIHPKHLLTSPTKASGNNKYQFQETSPRPLPSCPSNLAIFKFRQSAPCSRCHAAAGIWKQPSKANVKGLSWPKDLVQGETGRIEQLRYQFKVTLWQLTPIEQHLLGIHPKHVLTSPTKASGNNKYQFQETSPRPLPSCQSKLAIFRFCQSAPCSRCHAAAGIWEQPSDQRLQSRRLAQNLEKICCAIDAFAVFAKAPGARWDSKDWTTKISIQSDTVATDSDIDPPKL